MMNTDVEFHIRHHYTWNKLPANVKQVLGNSQREYEKAVVSLSVKNQLRYKGNLVRHVRKDERRYYEELLQYSKEHLMLYPYHLSDVMVKGLRITPFSYYIGIMSAIMSQEKSYDSLPNFTAADCLRLLGIGRNQYIDLMNQCRSTKKFFRRKPVRDLLPVQPVDITVEPWWVIQIGFITEDDVKNCDTGEKATIDKIIDSGAEPCGQQDLHVVHRLYKKGLIYLDVSIADEDCIIVPPLEGFVMNRVLGDYFETLLYKIFVSIDEHTSVAELANVLQIDLQLVKNAVSMYCRLGFARVKGQDFNTNDWHSSWAEYQSTLPKKSNEEKMLIDWTEEINKTPTTSEICSTPETISLDGNSTAMINASSLTNVCGHTKRIAFLFDSTLTAFLMMGNLSPGLKSHAVTMFEVGKLSDESLDSFLAELEKVQSHFASQVEAVAEGEAQRYFDHAITLRDTIQFLRHNPELCPDQEFGNGGLGIDLLRCESLLGLDPATCTRVLNKNYTLIVSMAPLSNEIRPISSCIPQHMGPAIPEVNSVWFKLFIYQLTGCGPPSLLLVKGTRLKRLPVMFQEYDRLLVTTWGHDPGVIPTSNILLTLNDALAHSAVLVQAHGWQTDGEIVYTPFPVDEKYELISGMSGAHSAVNKLREHVDLNHTCGFLSFLRTGKPNQWNPHIIKPQNGGKPGEPLNGITDEISAEMLASEVDSLATPKHLQRPNSLPQGLTVELTRETDWVLLDCCFGIPLFDASVNKTVCERIASEKLCSENSLQELLHSSRKLSLRLLNFIATNQDLDSSTLLDQNQDICNGNSTEQNVPYPTRNLQFNGTLQEWNGH
ncbi:protein FAM91A1-like [Tubulanus polymorphus]|uniref:protein FAM91A1-like n=1 Tax=Tubulanus polymorphus TaxID=672921 RepID=UPI003DA64DFB